MYTCNPLSASTTLNALRSLSSLSTCYPLETWCASCTHRALSSWAALRALNPLPSLNTYNTNRSLSTD